MTKRDVLFRDQNSVDHLKETVIPRWCTRARAAACASGARFSTAGAVFIAIG